MSKHTDYQTYARDCFATAYRYFETHKLIRDDEGWQRAAAAMGEHQDPFTCDLLTACVVEFEREYNENKQGG